jgi:DNA helicase II / ATP-dependent DNA helicase PcrA
MHRDPYEELSTEQRNALLGNSDVFLTACPGSGKTHSVAGRVAWLTSEDKRIALLSHTNVGAEEIARSISETYGRSLGPNNYVGTIHSFISKYTLQPFGHIETGAPTRVVIDLDRVRLEDPPGVDSTSYRFRPDGSLLSTRSDQ